jgi:M6 family metalloprotease-like protein
MAKSCDCNSQSSQLGIATNVQANMIACFFPSKVNNIWALLVFFQLSRLNVKGIQHLLNKSAAMNDSFPLHTRIATVQNHDGIKARALSPSLGQFPVLILLVRFSDHTDRELPPLSYFESLCNNNIVPYYSTQSYNQYVISACNVQDWITTDNTEAYYAQNNGNLVGSLLASAMFVPVLRQLDSQGFDFSQYDLNYDLNIDSLVVIHSGYASEQGSGTECGANSPQNRIVSQGHQSSENVWTSSSGISLSGYSIASAFDRVCPGTATWSTWGVPTHEWTHTLGTPDIYDIATRSSGLLGGVGTYDIMSNPHGPGGDGIAGGMSSYIKSLTEWIVPIEIQNDGTYTIRALNNYGDAYKISKGFPAGEYLLIENRNPEGYDSGLPGAGLLIYHIDENMAQQNRTGFPSQSGWPGNGNHYRCALLQADGKYDLEQEVNNGDAGDYWVQGMTLGPGNGQTYPNTDSYQNGNVQATGITITDISAAGSTMTFGVSGLGEPPVSSTTAPPVTPTTPSPTTAPPVLPTTPGPTTIPSISPTTPAPNAPITSFPTAQSTVSPTHASAIIVVPQTGQPTQGAIKVFDPPPTTSAPPVVAPVATLPPTMLEAALQRRDGMSSAPSKGLHVAWMILLLLVGV